MRNSLLSKLCFARTLAPLLLLSTLSTISLSACSTTPPAVGHETVAPLQPPSRPPLPRPATPDLRKFHVDVQPAVAGKPSLVTMTFPEYSLLTNDLGSLAIRICQDSWLLDYYEGKNNGVPPADWCQLKELPALPVPPAK